MRIARLSALGLLIVAATSDIFAQLPSQPSDAAGQEFDVVSIKRNTSSAFPGLNGSSTRPDGGFTLLNSPVITLIGRAYPVGVPADYIGLPAWATTDRYDVIATSVLRNSTGEQRAAMLKAMLAERFKLLVHVENREQPVYDLLVARSDGRLGPSMQPSQYDCAAVQAAQRAASEAALAAGKPLAPPRIDPNAPPPCVPYMGLARIDGDMTIATLARFLRPPAGRFVADKTQLTGSYRVTLTFDRTAGLRGPSTDPGDAPSVFTAVQEQLGLKLEPSRATRETLVIDRLERPTEN
jgi:uncharacterized protein (TIGR03435 family)